MSEVVKDRIFFHWEPPYESTVAGRIGMEPGSIVFSMSSPESGMLDRMRFEVPDINDLRDPKVLGKALAMMMAAGAAMGFRNGVLARSCVEKIEDIDLDGACTLRLIQSGQVKGSIERHQRNVAESAAMEGHTVVDWTRQSFSVVPDERDAT